jgi:hypothetical protein
VPTTLVLPPLSLETKWIRCRFFPKKLARAKMWCAAKNGTEIADDTAAEFQSGYFREKERVKRDYFRNGGNALF